MNATDPTPAAPPAYVPAPASLLRDPRTKSPLLAGMFSFMPGLGQVYVGYYPRGFLHITVVAGIVSILSTFERPGPYAPLLGLFLVFFWLYNVIDAVRLAAQYNQALAGGREPELPDSAKLPGIGGSVLGGAILIAASLITLLHTRWGVSLDWLGEWWPVFPLLFGVYLLGKALRERKA